MREKVVARAVRRFLAVDSGVAVVVFGLALALYLQGAYYGVAQLVVGAVLVAGVLLLPDPPVFGRADVPVALAAAGLASWAVVDGVVKDQAAAGVRAASLIAGALVLSSACRRLRGGARTDLVRGFLLVCLLVAALGWAGVVVHHPTWGFESPGLWRASSTLTYPNATAALLAVAALVCLAVREHGDRWLGVAAAGLVTGLAATMSRAGLLAFGVGAVVLVVGLGWRPVARAGLAPLLGAAVATAGLVPSTIAASPTAATIGLAAAAALAGLGVGGLLVRPRRLAPFAGVVVLAAVVVAARTAVSSRFTLDSPDRWASVRAGWRLFTDHPLTGVGPGLSRLVESTHGGVGVYRYVHNEYLQVLAELGAVGGALLVIFLVIVVRRVRRPRPGDRAVGVGVLAAVTAFLVHAGFDFVWHVPAVVLCVAALVGLASPAVDRGAATDKPLHKETERSTT